MPDNVSSVDITLAANLCFAALSGLREAIGQPNRDVNDKAF